MQSEFTLRSATEKDIPTILNLIREIGAYEKMSDEVVATEALLQEWIFDKKIAEVIFAEAENTVVGYALFFYNFSTFLGRGGIYLEDIFVLENYRGRGIGKALFKEVAHLAVERKCGRMEWQCLKWNKPSIDFYHSMGAKAMEEWDTYRLDGETLLKAGTL